MNSRGESDDFEVRFLPIVCNAKRTGSVEIIASKIKVNKLDDQLLSAETDTKGKRKSEMDFSMNCSNRNWSFFFLFFF